MVDAAEPVADANIAEKPVEKQRENAQEKVQEKPAENAEPAKKMQRRPTPKPAEAGEKAKDVEKPSGSAGPGSVLLFGKYLANVEISDPSVARYVRFSQQSYPNIFGRRKHHAYYEDHISIVERLANKLMRGGTGKKIGGRVIRTEGRLQGKKIKVMHIIEESFGIVNQKTGKNPMQVFVEALQNAAPIEDTTRVRYGGIAYNVAVGISSRRRVDVALRNVALAALTGAFRSRKRLADSLADELILASSNSPDSYAIKKRAESERIARRAR